MSDLWSTFYERVTQVRQQFRAWMARVSTGNVIEGLHPDSFWSESPVRVKHGTPAPNVPHKRRFRLIGEGEKTLLMVKHQSPGKHLYFDHVNERQLQWIGKGRRDVTGKRVPIYGDMVLRTNPDTLIDTIISDEQLWDELRRLVMPYIGVGGKRAVEWRRYWIHAHLEGSIATWQTQPEPLQEIIRVLGNLATKMESIEQPVEAPDAEEPA